MIHSKPEDYQREAFEAWRVERDRKGRHSGDFRTARLDEGPPPLPDEAYGGDVAGPKSGVSKSIFPKPPFSLVRASEMVFHDPEFVIEGLLETDTLGAVFGKAGSGKTFAVMDMACCVATGHPYHGRAVKQGAVVYIAGEGHNGLKRRQMAWAKHHGSDLSRAPLYFSLRSTNLMDAEATDQVMQAIEAAAVAEGVAPRLIVVDTLARNFGSGDENSTKDMNAFVVSVDSVRHAYPGSSVLLVHHTGHGDAGRSRGSSVLIGALDAEYQVVLEGTTTTLTNTKMKEATKPPPISFRAVSVEIGRNSKDEPVTSLAFELTEAPEKRPPEIKGQAKIALQALGDALAGHGEIKRGEMFPQNRQCVSLEHWREMCDRHSLSSGESDSARRKAFHTAKNVLQEKGMICVVDSYVWRVSE